MYGGENLRMSRAQFGLFCRSPILTYPSPAAPFDVYLPISLNIGTFIESVTENELLDNRPPAGASFPSTCGISFHDIFSHGIHVALIR